MDYVIKTTQFGFITLVIQDSRIVQIERTEKILLNAKSADYLDQLEANLNDTKMMCSKILEESIGLQFGNLVIKISNGKAVQIERTEKRRFPELEGLYGEGI